jgi:hypothetical protein
MMIVRSRGHYSDGHCGLTEHHDSLVPNDVSVRETTQIVVQTVCSVRPIVEF